MQISVGSRESSWVPFNIGCIRVVKRAHGLLWKSTPHKASSLSNYTVIFTTIGGTFIQWKQTNKQRHQASVTGKLHFKLLLPIALESLEVCSLTKVKAMKIGSLKAAGGDGSAGSPKTPELGDCCYLTWQVVRTLSYHSTNWLRADSLQIVFRGGGIHWK